MENVSPILAPDKSLMLEHLGLLFGRALSGRIEVTGIHTDKAAHHRPQTRFFDVGELDECSDYASEVNAQPGWNVYVGAALRSDDVFPGKAADDSDFLRTYVVWADADDDVQLASARATYRERGASPPFVVVTGRVPTKRAQLWWPLENPIDDIDTLRSSLRGIATALKTDPKVCTGKQLMRLAGGVNWPKKDDRILERTEIVRVTSAAREFPLEQISRAFPPLERVEMRSAGALPEVEVAHGGALGLTETVMDGRETYAFKLVRAHLREWVGTTGSEPTADELYKEVAPIYLAKADQVRPGRGPTFLMQKCAEAVRAYHAGQIPGMRNLEEAVLTWAQRQMGAREVEHGVEDDFESPAPPTDKPVIGFKLSDWTADRYAGPAKPIEWLCHGTVPLGIPVLFAAMGGMGKSYMALDAGLEVAVGVASLSPRRVLGGEITQHGSAVILSAEDSHDSIHRRLEEIDPESRRLLAPGRFMVVPLPDAGGPMPLIASDGKSLACTPAFYAIRDQLMAIPDLKLIVIDPLQAFVMADVNADPAAGQFMWSAFASLCALTGATLIVCHHMRKEGSSTISTPEQAREAIRGSTALVDGARLTYALWKMAGDEARDMCTRLDIEYAPDKIAGGAVVKANDKADRDVHTYIRQESGLLVDQTARVAALGPPSQVPRHVCQAIITEIGTAFVAAMDGRGEGFSRSPNAGERYAARLIKARAGCSDKEAKRLLEGWLLNGILQMQEFDAKRHKAALKQIGTLD